jgi:mono/diheme cytochrome c family protein
MNIQRVKGLGAMAMLTSAALLGVRGRTQEPPPAQQDATHAGQLAFDRVCKVCHGPEGRGDAGPRLVPFTREYNELLGIVREGTGQMPPISARQLPDEGVAQIVAYLESLSPER